MSARVGWALLVVVTVLLAPRTASAHGSVEEAARALRESRVVAEASMVPVLNQARLLTLERLIDRRRLYVVALGPGRAAVKERSELERAYGEDGIYLLVMGDDLSAGVSGEAALSASQVSQIVTRHDAGPDLGVRVDRIVTDLVESIDTAGSAGEGPSALRLAGLAALTTTAAIAMFVLLGLRRSRLRG